MKKIMLLAVGMILVLTMVGCKSSPQKTFLYDADTVTAFEVETGANEIIFEQGTSDKIEVDYESDVGMVQDGTFKVSIPMPNIGLNIKDPSPVSIRIPNKQFSKITLKSEAGSITLSTINGDEIYVNTNYGNITANGIKGKINAKSEMGKIKTELPEKDKIKSLSLVGQQWSSTVGEKDIQVNLITKVGNIEIK